MQLLSAKPVTEKLEAQSRVRAQYVLKMRGAAPKLAIVVVGSDPASLIYTRKKAEDSATNGMLHETVAMPADSTPAQVKAEVDRLNSDPAVDGILIQRPLPTAFNEEEVVYWVTPEKDVDAFHPINTGRLTIGLPCFQPCTPSGIMELLKHYKIQLRGKLSAVIGRSTIVGKPMATLLLQADATVLHCHSRTQNLAELTRQVDILVVAAGKPGLIDEHFIKPGAVVIDVGIHRNMSGKLVGDVNFESIANKASAATPVPGGVGPMTRMMLLQNTVRAAEQRL